MMTMMHKRAILLSMMVLGVISHTEIGDDLAENKYMMDGLTEIQVPGL